MRTKFTFLVTALVILASAQAAMAQQEAPLVGFLAPANQSVLANRYTAFRDKMRALDYVEGHTIRYAYRYSERDNRRLVALAAELVQLQPKVIVTTGTPATRAARRATRTIPIIMVGGDPVMTGMVKSLARPGGNITGQTPFPGPEFYGKRLAILKETVPAVMLVGALFVPTTIFHQRSLRALRDSAPKIGVTILPLPISKPDDVKGALEIIKRDRAGAFFYMGSPMIASRIKEMIAFALDNRLPHMCGRAKSVRQGCLIAYSTKFEDIYRRLALYADKILKGANPAEMPVQQPTEFDLTVNLKTAKALGIIIPPSILLRATEVIE